jgi:hypothetical protein
LKRTAKPIKTEIIIDNVPRILKNKVAASIFTSLG